MMTTISNIQNHNPNFTQFHLIKKGKIEGRLGINQSIRLINDPHHFYCLSSRLCFKHSLKEPLELVSFRHTSIFLSKSHSEKIEISSTTSDKSADIVSWAPDPFCPGGVYDLNDESWQVSTWTQRIWLASSCITLTITLAKCISLAINNKGPWLQLLSVALIGYLLADLTTGIYHWAIDNYGSSQTPIFGSHIAGFHCHHENPAAFAELHLGRILDVLSTVVALVIMPINVFSANPVVLEFVFVYAGCIMFSQLFHAWAHTSKGKLHVAIVALQNVGVLLGRSPHAAHHRPPHNNNYCMVSGIWNRFLDRSRFFVALEVVVFNVFRVKPRSWTDFPSSD